MTDLAAASPEGNELALLRQELAQRDAELASQRRAFDALQSIADATSDAPTVEQVFERAFTVLRGLTGHANLALRLYVPEANCLRLMAQAGMTPAMVEELTCVSTDWGLMAEVVREQRPAFTTNMPEEPERVGISPIVAGFKSIVSVPLLAAERLVGTMELATTTEHRWSEDELRWLSLLGRSLGINVRHVQLTERLHELAVSEERARLAQEMHDGLGQLLGSLHMWTEEAQASLGAGDIAGTASALHTIEDTVQDAYNTLREQILGLRMAITPGGDILPLLGKLVDRFRRQWNLRTDFVPPKGGEGQTLRVSPAQELQLLRVVQEALINVRRHARGCRVVVAVSETAEAISVSIEDDGIGFEPGSVGEDRLGLRIMRERAASVGGELLISSQPGHGTIVRIRLPRTRGIPLGEKRHAPLDTGG